MSYPKKRKLAPQIVYHEEKKPTGRGKDVVGEAFNQCHDQFTAEIKRRGEGLADLIKKELKKQIFPPNWEKEPKVKVPLELQSNADFRFKNVEVEISVKPIANAIRKQYEEGV